MSGSDYFGMVCVGVSSLCTLMLLFDTMKRVEKLEAERDTQKGER